MAKANKTPETETEAPPPLTDAQKAGFNATLNADPADGKKYTDKELEARRAAKAALLADEDGKTRFKRLSTARLNAALDVISLLGNLSGPNYDYSEAQVSFIRQKLHNDVDKAMDRFKPKVAKEDKETVEIPD